MLEIWELPRLANPMLWDSKTLVNENEKKFEQRLMRIFLVKQKPYSCNREDIIKDVSFPSESIF